MENALPAAGAYPSRVRSDKARRLWDLFCQKWESGHVVPNGRTVAIEAGASQPSASRMWRTYFKPHLKTGAGPRPNRARPVVEVRARKVKIPESRGTLEDVARDFKERAFQFCEVQRRTIALELARLEFIDEKREEGLPLSEARSLAGPSFMTDANRAAFAAGHLAKVSQSISGDEGTVVVLREVTGVFDAADASDYSHEEEDEAAAS